MRTILDQLRAPYGMVVLAVAGFLVWGLLVPNDKPAGTDNASDSPRSSPHSRQTPDRRFLVFPTGSDSFVPRDRNNRVDILLEDRVQRTITLVSTDSESRQGNGDSVTPSISDDGRYVAFRSSATNLVADDTNGFPDIFVKDMKTGAVTLVSADPSGETANGLSSLPTISPDGRIVTFRSWATNLVADDTNGKPDQFVRDLATGTTRVAL